MKKAKLSSKKEKIELELEKEIAKSFKEFAKEFDSNLSVVFKMIWRDFWEYQEMKWGLIDLGSIDARLQAIEEHIAMEPSKDIKVIRTLGGKIIKK